MTRFVGESISTRSGRKRTAVLGKDLRKGMQEFLKTGKHPILEQTLEERSGAALTQLPTVDINRPHVFMDFHQGGGLLGRVVVELFMDSLPSLCTAFQNRCLEGVFTVKNTNIHKLQPHFAAFGGLSTAQRPPPPTAPASRTRLQHTDPGILSVHRDGSHFALALGRALVLDEEYFVVGRLACGAAVVAALNDADVDPRDAPVTPITIAECGTCNHKGDFEKFSGAVATGVKSGSDAKEAVRSDLQAVGRDVEDALADGLKKRARQPAAAQAAATATKKPRGMLAELDGLSDDDSDDESDAGSAADGGASNAGGTAVKANKA